jgi:hypothetical protein
MKSLKPGVNIQAYLEYCVTPSNYGPQDTSLVARVHARDITFGPLCNFPIIIMRVVTTRWLFNQSMSWVFFMFTNVAYKSSVLFAMEIWVLMPISYFRFLYWVMAGATPGIYKGPTCGTRKDPVITNNVPQISGLALDNKGKPLWPVYSTRSHHF